MQVMSVIIMSDNVLKIGRRDAVSISDMKTRQNLDKSFYFSFFDSETNTIFKREKQTCDTSNLHFLGFYYFYSVPVVPFIINIIIHTLQFGVPVALSNTINKHRLRAYVCKL